ncbi:MAG: DUF4013 domain-containing protein [Planctomycetia bacterium]|nr:DUF4013 domain-containing protein [Planctomycetia bacterium]
MSMESSPGPTKIRHLAAYTSFMDSPRWGMNLLCGCVCMLVPIIGPMVLYGWLGEVLKSRLERPGEPTPDFDTNKLMDYLQRGLWPFLVGLLVGTIGGVVVVFPFVCLFYGPIIAAVATNQAWPLAFLPLAFVVLFVGIVVIYLYMLPMVLRASLQQDFAAALRWSYVRDFVGRVRKELILAVVFLYATAFVLEIAGLLVFIIGLYPVAVLITYAFYHLMYQLYLVYLERGGEPIPIKATQAIFGSQPSPPPVSAFPPSEKNPYAAPPFTSLGDTPRPPEAPDGPPVP